MTEILKELWHDGDGLLRCTIYVDAQNIECQALPKDHALALGFYDEHDRPVPSPIDRWAAAASAKAAG